MKILARLRRWWRDRRLSRPRPKGPKVLQWQGGPFANDFNHQSN